MKGKRISVVPYEARWEKDFLDLRTGIEKALGGLAVGIEHVGSTAVEGLPAKPIVDIDAVIEDRSQLSEAIARLAEVGYRHEGDLGIAGREAFRYEGKNPLPEHHLYVCARDSAELRRHIAFRDYLRSHPEAAREYGRIKEEGAALYPHDADLYIRHKAPFVEGIYRKIGL
ncbi:MAG: GrpB family protein [Clostridia bacterium]|nr:GrpB family protein [Clostridia bacterium]